MNAIEGEDYAHAHKLAYAIGMTSEIHDKARLSDDDTIRLEVSPGMLDQVIDEIMSGYVAPATEEDMVVEIQEELNEWENIALIWDDVMSRFPNSQGRMHVNINHRDSNWWDVEVINRQGGKTAHFTYLIRNGKAELQ